MESDVGRLFRYLRMPDFPYRDEHARPLARASRSAPRSGAALLALVSLVRGVGRTTLAANLAAALARRGLRAAAVDLDPVGSLAAHFASAPGDPPRALEWTERTAGYVPWSSDPSHAVELASDCDAAVLDTAAGQSDAMEQALSEADEVVVVLRPDEESLRSLSPMETLLARVRMRSWRRTRARYLLNRFDGRRPLDRAVLQRLRAALGGRLLSPPVQEDAAVALAAQRGKNLHDLAPRSQVTADLEALASLLVPSARGDA